MILFLLFAVLFIVLISLLSAEEVSRPVKPSSQTCFSPDGGCIDVLVKEISKARLEIFVMAYSFRSLAVAQALITAHQRGVKVEVILDKSERQEGYTPAVMNAENLLIVHSVELSNRYRENWLKHKTHSEKY